MILDKYQKVAGSRVEDRGHSSICNICDDDGKRFLIKWIKGIDKSTEASRIFHDRLRRLKRAKHDALIQIVDFGWDSKFKSHYIIFTDIETTPLFRKSLGIKPLDFFCGMLKIVGCLRHLHINEKVSHGDITAANILVDDDNQFYLMDFGLTDIVLNLSKTNDLSTFIKRNFAPEKWDKSIPKGFPYQSDVYSIGKVIEWYLENNRIEETEETKELLENTCKRLPAERFNYLQLKAALKAITEIDFDDKNIVRLSGSIQREVLNELNNKYFGDEKFTPIYDVFPQKKENVQLLNIITKNYKIHCMWIVDECEMLVRELVSKKEKPDDYSKSLSHGREISIPIMFSVEYNGGAEYYNMTKVLKKQNALKDEERGYRTSKRKIGEELDFYKELLEKEKEVIKKNSLRLAYSSYEVEENHEICFTIADNDKYSNNGHINSHIDQATPPNPKEFEYNLSPSSDEKKLKDAYRLNGEIYDFNKNSRILKIRDCERIDPKKIPHSGFLLQNTIQEESEKNRQLDAIRKVRNREVQNPSLIDCIFEPEDLSGCALDNKLEKIFQKDKDGKEFEYSCNQKTAILNALHREPLTVIQGPPGTGKTTVITEIIFQILDVNPSAKILITSQTNDAVDNVLDNLLSEEIPFIRLSGIRKPKGNLKNHTLEKKIEGWKSETKRKSKRNWDRYEKQTKSKLAKGQDGRLESEYQARKALCLDWEKAINSIDVKSKLNEKLIDSIKVVGATTNHIASNKYKQYNFEFDYVIMDESGKATLAESLIPIVMAEKLVLVGDHRQLRPMLTGTREVESWLRNKYKEEANTLDGWDDYFNRPSLFETIIEKIDEDYKSQLDECRRCSEEQVKLISKCFYEAEGDEAIIHVPRPIDKEHNLNLQIDSSIIFYDIGNTHPSDMISQSSRNRYSAKLIPDILKELDKKNKVKDYSIGVITGYKSQVREIKNNLNRINYKHFRNIKNNTVVASVVDKFQGLEKDIVIFDLVRSGQGSLGFLANANRVNVALSRQKKLLIIIGDLASIKAAKAPRGMNLKGRTALQNFIDGIRKECIVTNIKQIF